MIPSALRNLDLWAKVPPLKQDRLAREVAGGEFGLVRAAEYAGKRRRIHTLRHCATGVDFQLIPGGRYWMGLTPEEETAFRALYTHEVADFCEIDIESMKPPTLVTIAPFLLARFPLLESQAHAIIELDDNPYFEFAGEDPPYYFNWDELDRLWEAVPFRLPSEAEWEWGCRGGNQTLFWWGDDIPSRELEAALAARPVPEPPLLDDVSNPFGLGGLTAPELCMDGRNHLAGRGAGTMSWPWQGEGWPQLLSALSWTTNHHAFFQVGCVRLAATLAGEDSRRG